MISRRLVHLVISLVACLPLRAQQVESGSFRLHKFQQAIGEERYVVARNGDHRLLTDSFAFTDRGSRVALNATLITAPDHAPVRFGIRGKNSRFATVSDSVDIGPQGANTWADSGTWHSVALKRGEPLFTIAGYAPVAVQQELMRYWLGHGRPAAIRALPSGNTIRITARGVDTMRVGAEKRPLQRYSVSGLIWGGETLWMDDQGALAALVSIDAEFDHFEAARNEYAPALEQFVARAGADGATALAEMAELRARQGRFALVGATVVDGTGAAPIPDATVVVEAGRIVAVGPRGKVKVPAGSEVINAKGKWITPGLFDMHAHYEQVEWGPIYLAAGVTTARDVGNEFAFITAVRDAIRAGRGLGPQILTAGIIDGSGPRGIGVDRADTPEEGVRLVQRYHDAGFQQIKIYSSVTLPTLTAITAEAHRLHMTVTGHVPGGLDAFQAVTAGMDQINHISFIVPRLKPTVAAGTPAPALDLSAPEAASAIAFFKEHHTVLDPTLALYEWNLHASRIPVGTIDPGALKVAPELAAQIRNTGVDASREAAAQTQFAEMLATVGAMHKAGVTIVAGTDQTIPGHSLHRELELYVKAGFTPMEALQAATSVPARVMGIDGDVGTVSVGKRADLLLLDADPLAKIENLRAIRLVVADGRRYDPAPLWRAAGFIP